MRKGKRYNLVHPREWILLYLQHHIHKHPCDSDVVKQLCVYPNIAAVYSKYICCLFISLYVYIHFFTIAHGGESNANEIEGWAAPKHESCWAA